MRAFHTLRVRQNSQLADFEFLTLIISALEWRKQNGEIFLVTDNAGRKIMEDLGLTEIWNGVDNSLEQFGSFGIDEEVFWAGAKIFALTRQPLPCVMMDLDFIVWQKFNFAQFKSDIAVIHRESLNLPCYPHSGYFRFKNNFALPEHLNWALKPCNAALVYFGNQKFVSEYYSFAFDFMRAAAPENQELLPYMVFIEQRWMAMCAEKNGVPIHSLSNLKELFGRQKLFTHLWGHKQILRDNPDEAEIFCKDCAGRIAHDFPDFAKKLANFDWAGKYFAD